MSRLNTFISLPAGDKYLLLKINLVLWLIRLGLWVLPFQTLCRLLARWKSQSELTNVDPLAVEKIVWGIKLMSSYTPDASCLTQALTTVALMGRIGQPADLRIGVRKDNEGALKAHAWVESQGKIVMGKLADLSSYSILTPIEKLKL